MPLQLKFAKLFCVAAIAALPLYAQTYEEISYPNSTGTFAAAINDSNEIVGQYQDFVTNQTVYHAYLYEDGDYTNIDPPGSTFATASGINDSGTIVGGYTTTSKEMGFIDTNGTYSDVVYPGSRTAGTALSGINNKGVVVGTYWFRNSKGDWQMYGFILDNGKYTQLVAPGSYNTLPSAITDSGKVIGFYSDSNGNSYGFTYQNGKFTIINYPGAVGNSGVTDEDNGILVGGYGMNGASHGFELKNGKYTTIDYPGDLNTTLNGINKGSYVVGTYWATEYSQRYAFLRIP
jgi:probable HAF family extracellular repeat protein